MSDSPQQHWTSLARLSVLISLGFTVFCMGIYLLNWASTGEGSWDKLLEGSLNIAGPVALVAFVCGAFLHPGLNRPEGHNRF